MWLVRPKIREINGMMRTTSIVGGAETYGLGGLDKERQYDKTRSRNHRLCDDLDATDPSSLCQIRRSQVM